MRPPFLSTIIFILRKFSLAPPRKVIVGSGGFIRIEASQWTSLPNERGVGVGGSEAPLVLVQRVLLSGDSGATRPMHRRDTRPMIRSPHHLSLLAALARGAT